MPRAEVEVVTFRANAAGPVVAAMGEVASSGGWLKLQPAIDEDDAAYVRDRPAIFSGRGPTVPVCTWVPGERTRKGEEYVAVGIEHGSGPKAAERLADAGVAVPQGWAVLQDNPRRGFVVATLPSEDPAAVLAWLLDAAQVLSPVPFTGEWRAFVRRRR
jgi:hypothetical protein